MCVLPRTGQRSTIDAVNVDSLFDWLVDGAPGATSAAEIAERVGNDLQAAGIPLERFNVMVTTLHPNVLGRAFIWERGKPLRLATLTQEVRESQGFRHSPFSWTHANKREWRWRKGDDDRGYGVIHDLRAKGCVDYFSMPLFFTSGDVHVAGCASLGLSIEHGSGSSASPTSCIKPRSSARSSSERGCPIFACSQETTMTEPEKPGLLGHRQSRS
jgi:hypothetical protein